MKRRRALAWLLLLPLGYPVVRWVARLRSSQDSDWKRAVGALGSDYLAELKALTRALLPGVLSRQQTNAVALDFVRWLEGQNPRAELSHLGYKLRREDLATSRPGARRAAIDATNYARQLEQLRTLTTPRRLPQLDRVEATLVLTSALQVSGARDIPAGPTGANLLLDLLSFYYRQPSTVDLFHGRRIGALQCRGLDGVDREPAPLAAGA